MHCTHSYTSVGKLQFVVSLCPDFCVWAEKREPGTVYAPTYQYYAPLPPVQADGGQHRGFDQRRLPL